MTPSQETPIITVSSILPSLEREFPHRQIEAGFDMAGFLLRTAGRLGVLSGILRRIDQYIRSSM